MNKNAKDDAKFWVDGIKKIMIEKAEEMIQNPFYRKGYDSPVARFVVGYMYQYLKRGLLWIRQQYGATVTNL